MGRDDRGCEVASPACDFFCFFLMPSQRGADGDGDRDREVLDRCGSVNRNIRLGTIKYQVEVLITTGVVVPALSLEVLTYLLSTYFLSYTVWYVFIGERRELQFQPASQTPPRCNAC